MRRFPTAGPVAPADHYHLPPLSRIGRDRVLDEAEWGQYFVVYGPPQTGKTTTLIALRDLLNERGYRCVYASFRGTHPDSDDLGAAMAAVLERLASEARATLGDDFLARESPGILDGKSETLAFYLAVHRWAAADPKPLALLLDDVDSLPGYCFDSLMHQIRAGYENCSPQFPRTMAVCGIRRIEYFAIQREVPFNCVSNAYRIGDFSEDEIRALLGQHTEETGQPFSPEAVEEIRRATAGQPWLVNALADSACFDDPDGQHRPAAITEEAVTAARERLLRARPLPLRQVADRLDEESVRQVVEPIFAGERAFCSFEDWTYATALGLVRPDRPGRLPNPIHCEVLRTTLAARNADDTIPPPGHSVPPEVPAPSRPAIHR